ncbi:phosphate ABC transporter substrate-binding protein PstS [Leptolyngbya sp. NIES-2104]|uniref:phosphate ABC transporter substrate-binding protein PstS n=1 Tax=Leptolyngbya sp. NIES-2104 TaxID=1552121 RepID=UPI00073EB965|nr:phosphate ABC transporter substrate-binding protein PstS [Leptolyngbya sp. NIES-2104]
MAFFQKKAQLGASLSSLAALTFGLAACTPQTANTPPQGATGGSSPASAPSAGGGTISINGAGASAPNLVYQRWFQEYNKQNPNVQISYDSVGSGAGVRRFLDQTVDFGATDDPLKDEDRAKVPADRGKAIQVPSTGLFIVMAHSLKEVPDLKLSREALCGIVDGSIKTWDDPKIKANNPNVPSQPLTFVHRSDGSGTTAIFTRHVEKACPNWKGGSGKTVEWPAGTGAKGNEGVTAQIQQTPGAIGYTEYSFSKQNNLPTASLQNKSGAFVAPTPEAAAKALEGVNVPETFAVNVPDPEGKDAYPIVSLTYLLLYENPRDPARAKAFNDFLKWAYGENGKKFATELGYLPLPETITTKAASALETIKVATK